ncbi:unnamed protein product [Rotaria sordida]|uniref:peptidylprolyl isomerase n=3 Tax=Rotaria sordida TaxID=392033 RepID=A0A814T2Y3_9BILA|nr:unnamed protein product [Rotaria sordida]CAF1156269.1 unnamed protein product [Rotaria sordida]
MLSNQQAQIQLKGEDISPAKDGCLLKEIIHQSVDDEKAMFDDTVYIHYIGTLLDGTVFENTRDRNEKLSFNFGKGEVIKAWDIGVATMKRGEISRFISKPKYAYGLKGLGDKVGSAVTVIFEIELVDCVGKDISDERDQSIVRRIIKRGEVFEQPNEDATVQIYLKGTHQGQIFDERTVTFFAGGGCLQNIPLGVEYAIFRMTKSEYWKLYLKSKATKGVEKFHIPADSPVEYEVTMIEFERAKDDKFLTDEEKLKQSEILKQRGDEFVKGGHYELAVKKYRTVYNYLLSASLRSSSDIEQSRQLKFASQSNLALCYLKLGDYSPCIRACENALLFDSQNEKCLFRRGQCQLARGNFREAIQDFETVIKVNPSNVVAKQQIQECIQQIQAYEVKKNELYNSTRKTTVKADVIDKADETKTSLKNERKID